jgi:hypothetical protein
MMHQVLYYLLPVAHSAASVAGTHKQNSCQDPFRGLLCAGASLISPFSLFSIMSVSLVCTNTKSCAVLNNPSVLKFGG